MPVKLINRVFFPGLSRFFTKISRAGRLRIISAVFILLFLSLHALAAPTVLYEWNFEREKNAQGWTGHHLSRPGFEGGSLSATITGQSPILYSPQVDITPHRWQVVELRVKGEFGATGKLYYTDTTEGRHGGFSTGRNIVWQSNVFPGTFGKTWNEYRIYPFWEKGEKILKFRLDLPTGDSSNPETRRIEIAWIRVIDLGRTKKAENPPLEWDTPSWSRGVDGFYMSDPFSRDVFDFGYWSVLELKKRANGKAWFRFATESGGFTDIPLELDDHGVCNFPLAPCKTWKGRLEMIGFKIENTDMERDHDAPKLSALAGRVAFPNFPQGPPDVRVDAERSGLTDAICRTGKDIPFELRLDNSGGKSGSVEIDMKLPEGVRLMEPRAEELKKTVFEVAPLDTARISFLMRADRPVADTVEVIVRPKEKNIFPARSFLIPFTVMPPVRLPPGVSKHESYVPEPKPIESDYEIGTYYFPGWSRRMAWDKIEKDSPIRKPVLGWYDEADPECIDWQIKWAVESGIHFFFVDWYWKRGDRYHTHWIESFQKAKYKSYLKWAVMWANHTGSGYHSEEDQAAVADFWIEHFFKTPEYYTIDGKPVVVIWRASSMDNDVIDHERKKGKLLKKGEGVKRLLDSARKKAVEAGLPGVFFIAMKWPEASTSPDDIRWLKDAGFDMTTIYHFMDHEKKAANPRRFDFSLVVDASLPYWRKREETGILPFQPNLSSGWNDRPWHGESGKRITGRTVEGFRRICEDYKMFASESGNRRPVLAPLNEWGEGSYLEPNLEFGFGMYESVRDVLCKEPADDRADYYGPSDIGLGPYDLPPTIVDDRKTWDFKDGSQGWTPYLGIRETFKTEEGRLTMKSVTGEAALALWSKPFPAERYKRLAVRMSVTPVRGKRVVQFYWSPFSAGFSNDVSLTLPLVADGKYHEYVFEPDRSPHWRGWITALRLDPVDIEGASIEIDGIRLE